MKTKGKFDGSFFDNEVDGPSGVIGPLALSSSAVDVLKSMPMNYVGNKRRVLNQMGYFLNEEGVEFESVFDAFGGSGVVAAYFSIMGKKAICNEILSSSALTINSLFGVKAEQRNKLPVEEDILDLIINTSCEDSDSFVTDNYAGRFFTEEEAAFLDTYKTNIADLFNGRVDCGTQSCGCPKHVQISDHNISLKNTHQSAFAIFLMQHLINQLCFVGGRYYNGQTIAKLDHRLKHNKNKGLSLTNDPISSMGLGKIRTFLYNLHGYRPVKVYNADVFDLLDSSRSKFVQTDLLYLDPPYGGESSDYGHLYKFLEEYLYGKPIEELKHIQKGAQRFKGSKGYADQFEELLALCGDYPNWLISFNESSFASLDDIISLLKKFRKDVRVHDLSIGYRYRKDQYDLEHYDPQKHEVSSVKDAVKGTEYLILARA